VEDTATHRLPLVLIHGAWLSSGSWENFADYFRGRGYAGHASTETWRRSVKAPTRSKASA
jgi:pimeloyl-ACP methyl ester carboxylesterase